MALMLAAGKMTGVGNVCLFSKVWLNNALWYRRQVCDLELPLTMCVSQDTQHVTECREGKEQLG